MHEQTTLQLVLAVPRQNLAAVNILTALVPVGAPAGFTIILKKKVHSASEAAYLTPSLQLSLKKVVAVPLVFFITDSLKALLPGASLTSVLPRPRPGVVAKSSVVVLAIIALSPGKP